jgi:hypothetical protein
MGLEAVPQRREGYSVFLTQTQRHMHGKKRKRKTCLHHHAGAGNITT